MSIFSSIGKAIGGVLGSTGFGNAISALGTIGSIVGGSQQRANQQAINEANIQMQRETNALQEKMFNQNLDWQRESQEIQNEYNSMSSQLQRAQAAGVSGAALLGQNGPVGNIGASLGSSGSSIPSLQAPRAEMIDSSSKNMISNVSLIAKALSDVSSSGLSDAKANEINTMLAGNLEKLQKQNEGLELYNMLSGIDLQWKQLEKKKQYDLLCSQYSLQASEIALNDAYTETEKEKKLLTIEETYHRKMQGLIAKKDYEVFDEKWNLTKQQIRQTIATQKAEAAKSYAEANKATQEGALAASRTVWQELENKVHANDVVISNKTLNAEIQKAVNEAKTSKAITEQTRKQIDVLSEQLEHWKDVNNTFMYQLIFDDLMKLISTATGVNHAVNESVNTGTKAAAAAALGGF